MLALEVSKENEGTRVGTGVRGALPHSSSVGLGIGAVGICLLAGPVHGVEVGPGLLALEGVVGIGGTALAAARPYPDNSLNTA